VSGEVDVVSGSGSATIVAVGRGLPVVIVGSFGSATYKLVANPGVTDLRGRTVGTSRVIGGDKVGNKQVELINSKLHQRSEGKKHIHRA
jgi:hypothetical protein